MSSPRALSCWLLGGWLVGAGCTGSSQPSYPGPPAAVLGTGVFAFTAIAECARVPIIHGIQGGYHVWGSVRLRYMNFDKAHLRFSVSDAAGAMVENPINYVLNLQPLAPETLIADRPVDALMGGACPDGGHVVERSDGGPPVPGGTDGWGEAIGALVFMPLATTDGGLVVPTIDGITITVRLDATDADGRAASDQRTFIPYYNN